MLNSKNHKFRFFIHRDFSINCEIAVASAADPTPMPRPAIKKISRTTLTQEEIIRYISGWRPSPTDCRTPTKILYMTTPAPMAMPLIKPTIRKIRFPDELTAASALLPRKFPTIRESAVLYNCWNRFPRNNGIAKK